MKFLGEGEIILLKKSSSASHQIRSIIRERVGVYNVLRSIRAKLDIEGAFSIK